MPILELSSVSSMFTEAGALAAPVAEVATEFQTTEMGHSLVEILPFGRIVHLCVASLQRHVGVSGRRCRPTQHGIFGEFSPTVRRRDASATGFLGLGHSMAKATRGAHAEGQCSPAQVAAEEKGQAGNREGTSQRPLMMRRGAMLAGSGCG